MRDNVCMKVTASASRRHGHSYGYKRGCDLCRTEAAQAKRELRARKRGLRPVPDANASEAVADVRQDVAPEANASPGPVVAAVRAELDALGDLTGWQGVAAAAVAMARILDHPNLATTQPSAAKVLASLLWTLRQNAVPRRGRLAVVEAMTSGRA